jgi:hypothetical protein
MTCPEARTAYAVGGYGGFTKLSAFPLTTPPETISRHTLFFFDDISLEVKLN